MSLYVQSITDLFTNLVMQQLLFYKIFLIFSFLNIYKIIALQFYEKNCFNYLKPIVDYSIVFYAIENWNTWFWMSWLQYYTNIKINIYYVDIFFRLMTEKGNRLFWRKGNILISCLTEKGKCSFWRKRSSLHLRIHDIPSSNITYHVIFADIIHTSELFSNLK